MTNYLSLAKPRILALLIIASLSSAVIAGQGSLAIETAILLTLSGSLASAGAAFLNNYYDRDIDAVMERTRQRPLPSGKVSAPMVLLVGVVLITVAVLVALSLNFLVVVFVLGGVLIYNVLYTLWLKRRTSLNIIIGGLAGSCAVLGGWFAVTPNTSPALVIIALIVFLWTPSHFWSLALVHQESYRTASIPMLPVQVGARTAATCILLSTMLLVTASLFAYFFGSFHGLYLVSAGLSGMLFLSANVMLWRQPTRKLAWFNFKLSGVYLLSLFLAMVVDIVVY